MIMRGDEIMTLRRMREMMPMYARRLVLSATATLIVTSFTGCLHPRAAYLTNVTVQHLTLPDAAPGKICFARGDFIYLKELVSGKEVRLLKGQSPQISPDGKKVLFMSGESNDAINPWRIRLLDLASKQVREFTTLVGRDASSPRWSIDGSKIAFETVDSNRGSGAIGLLDPLTGEWKIIFTRVDLGPSEGTFTLDSWGPGDQSILVHTLEHLYEVSVTGKLAWQMPIADLGIDSETRFSLSSDKKYLLFDSTIDTKERPVNSAVKMLDVSTRQVITVTPDTVEARTPTWLPTEKAIMFKCMKRFDHPHQSNICTIGSDGKDLSVLVKDAQQVSYSGQ